jgi:hypothetical protein
MNWWEYLALALELWTVVGALGLTISLVRQERQKLGQGVASLVAVWVIYLAALAVVAHRQPEQRVAMGRPACIHKLCYTVEGVDEVPGFPARNHERLVRLTIVVKNQGKSETHEDLRGFLLDAQGRAWVASDAVSGNPLNGRVLAGTTMVSQPVFRLAPDAAGLELVLRHERAARWLRHSLVIGDPESVGHRMRVMVLDR